MLEDFFSIPRSETAGLVEVLDDAGFPLCLMGAEEAGKQNLRHKSAALLLRDNRGRNLLCWRKNSGFGFSSYGKVPAGLGVEEFARQLLQSEWNREFMRELAVAAPCGESGNAIVHIFEAPISHASANNIAAEKDRFLLADDAEIGALITENGIISPLFATIFLAGILSIAAK